MQIGLHVSISGSVANAVTNAVERECSAFQIFTGNPRGWYSKDLTNEDVSNYKKNLSECDIDRFCNGSTHAISPQSFYPRYSWL